MILNSITMCVFTWFINVKIGACEWNMFNFNGSLVLILGLSYNIFHNGSLQYCNMCIFLPYDCEDLCLCIEHL